MRTPPLILGQKTGQLYELSARLSMPLRRRQSYGDRIASFEERGQSRVSQQFLTIRAAERKSVRHASTRSG
jgi:hypothetical protein